ncbi:MAG: phage terminase large subunit family protein [Acidobacteria bacterium]|nr:phage terminase large subunit family protein [Acidobacteriota bacterium]
MLDATPELRDRIVKPGPRKSGNSATFKAYPGGSLSIVGANSAVSLRSTPARFVLLDEIDAYPPDVGEEGDPVALAMARTATFKASRKILLTSTPTLEGVSRIAAAYAETDQRRLFWLCGHCGERFVPDWSQIGWPEDHPEKAFLACPHCGGIHEQRDQARLIAGAEWRATAEGQARVRGHPRGGLRAGSRGVHGGQMAPARMGMGRSAEGREGGADRN